MKSGSGGTRVSDLKGMEDSHQQGTVAHIYIQSTWKDSRVQRETPSQAKIQINSPQVGPVNLAEIHATLRRQEAPNRKHDDFRVRPGDEGSVLTIYLTDAGTPGFVLCVCMVENVPPTCLRLFLKLFKISEMQ